MILTDREIQIAIERGFIEIKPLPEEKAYSSTNIDLTLDPNLTKFKKHKPYVHPYIDPTHKDYDIDEALQEITELFTIDAESGWPLLCGELFLGWTHEYVHLKTDARLGARVEGKSSLARLGLGVHVTAPIIHAGFEGQIRLEIVNHGVVPILLKPGMRICQLVFEQTLGTPQRGYKGQFLGQTAPAPVPE